MYKLPRSGEDEATEKGEKIMGTITILPETTKHPITLIGERAGICWGADITDAAKNYKRGWDCIVSGHGRTLEFVTIDMVIDGYSARVIREYMRHVGGGLSVLQASTRYIDYGEFDYVTPNSIADSSVAAKGVYESCMTMIANSVRMLEMEFGIPREDAAMLLPLGMTTKLVDHKNLRNLIDMSHNRLCTRAYWEFRDLMGDLIIALNNYSEEWATVTEFLQPKCYVLGYCPETHGCGMMPKKGEQ